MKYLFKIIQERAKEQGKDVLDTSFEDIYQALTQLRKKFPKWVFRTKISTFKSIKKTVSLAFDGVNIASKWWGVPYVAIKRFFLNDLINQ